MDPKDIEEFKEAFLMLDRDGDGKISWEELGYVMKILGHKMSESQLKEIMKLIDENGNGVIDFQMFHCTVFPCGESHGVKPDFSGSNAVAPFFIRELFIFKILNSPLNLKEFIDVLLKTRAMTDSATETREELKEAFKVFDLDGDGIITAKELKVVMKSLGQDVTEPDIDEMIKEADKNLDGRVDFDEFVEMMERK